MTGESLTSKERLTVIEIRPGNAYELLVSFNRPLTPGDALAVQRAIDGAADEPPGDPPCDHDSMTPCPPECAEAKEQWRRKAAAHIAQQQRATVPPSTGQSPLVDHWRQIANDRSAEILRLQNELLRCPQPPAADRRDAERYRWLRKGNDYERKGPMVVLCEAEHMESDDRPFWSMAESALDEAVDAAMCAPTKNCARCGGTNVDPEPVYHDFGQGPEAQPQPCTAHETRAPRRTSYVRTTMEGGPCAFCGKKLRDHIAITDCGVKNACPLNEPLLASDCPNVGCTIEGPHTHNSGGPESGAQSERESNV